MKTKITLIYVAILSLFFSCQKDAPSPTQTTTPTTIQNPVPTPTVANFTFSGTGVAPSTVTFTNSSVNASSYSWDFGDNVVSNEENPTHKYSIEGNYGVKLTATKAGVSNSVTKIVNIKAPTVLKITSIKITSLPLTKSGGVTWDIAPNSGPDVTFSIEKVPLNTQYDHPFFEENVVASTLPINFILQNSKGVPSPINLPADNNLYSVSIWDYDEGKGQELITSLSFVPYNYKSGTDPYPTTFTLSRDGTIVVLTVKWE